ncbi:hypothetical protein NIES4071_29530 [Calothrix sp. NIES-4071]|nr:hypothetical protein NIES4071_29530 [Calothrix sp. NIES-4071]BAZ57273.1 hypothetical protein NIES4105_29470 [Calothrix sp. NIES-4105]
MLSNRPLYNNRLFELEQQLVKLKQSTANKLVEAKNNENTKLNYILNYSSGYPYNNPYNNRLLALEQELLEVRQKNKSQHSQGFEFNRVENATQMMSLEVSSPQGQLWKLEQNLCARKHKKQQQNEKPVNKEVVSMAFDFDEPIELHYNGITIPATVSYKTTEQPYYKTFEALDTEVESFDVTDTEVPIHAYETSQSSDNFEKRHQANGSEENNKPSQELLDKSEFAADLSVILDEEKVDANEAPNITPVIPQPATQQFSQVKSHSIFDQVAENLAYANSFDLGTLTLEQRFDEFDRILDQHKQSTAQAANDFYLNPFLGNGEL